MSKKNSGDWFCCAAYAKGLDYIQYTPAKRDPTIDKKCYCQKQWYPTKDDCVIACEKLNKKTKIGKSGMKVANKSSYDKMTIAKLIKHLQSLPNHDQEIVIYPKYSGSDCQSDSKYRFTIAEMQDQWHRNYPYIALMF